MNRDKDLFRARGIAKQISWKDAIDADLLNRIERLLDRLQSDIREESYPSILERFHQAQDAREQLGGELINIIPGDVKTSCTQLCLAFSSSTHSSRHKFPEVMRSVREYLIDCSGIAQAVILLTDTWSPRQVEESAKDVHAHARQGRFVVPCLVSGRTLTTIDWP